MIGLEHFLKLTAVIFSIGLYGALTKTNIIAIYKSIELMFNGVNIMAVAFSRWITPYTLSNEPSVITEEVVRHLLTGQAFAIFIIAVAAAEVALGLGIVMAIYRVRETVSITEANLLKR